MKFRSSHIDVQVLWALFYNAKWHSLIFPIIAAHSQHEFYAMIFKHVNLIIYWIFSHFIMHHASCIFQFIFKGEHALKSCKVHEIAFKMRRLSPRIKFQLIKSVLCDLSELKIFHYSNAVIKWTKSETHIHTSTRNTVRRENERKKYGERETTKMKIVWMNGVVEILHAKPK